jgi:hypothetical protein
MVRREDLAHAVADAACAVPGVAGLNHRGAVEISTQFAGGKVLGIRLLPDYAEVHIIADRGPLPQVAEDVRAAVAAVLTAAGEPRHVVVAIDDITAGAIDRRTRTPS